MFNYTIDKIAEIVSLSLTTPTVISAGVVITMWFLAFIKAVFTREKRTGQQWLVIGITISFFCDSGDNLWWGSAWGRHFLEHSSSQWWFDKGIYANIPLRQIGGIFAACCHVKGALVGDQNENLKMKVFNLILVISTILSFFVWESLS